MITDITDTSYKINDELIDLTSLYTRAQLLGDGKTIHDAMMCLSILDNTLTMLKRGKDKWPMENEEKILGHFNKLRVALNKGGV